MGKRKAAAMENVNSPKAAWNLNGCSFGSRSRVFFDAMGSGASKVSPQLPVSKGPDCVEGAEPGQRITVPLGPVDGTLSADPCASSLLNPEASWNYAPKESVPHGSPTKPNRQNHEDHLVKLDEFREEVKQAPVVISAVVELKREDHDSA
eukprot:symbB.v1.2.009269.t1/scaffold584.1/size184464/4